MKDVNKMLTFFKFAFSICPKHVLLLLFNAFVNSGRIFANVILPKYLIDELMGDKEITKLVFFGCLIVISNVLFTLLINTLMRLLTVSSAYVNQEMQRFLANKIMNIEYCHLEDPYYLDLKERAKFAITSQSALENLIDGFADMVKNFVTVTGLVVIMFQLSWVLIVLLLVTVGIMLVIQISSSSYQVAFFEEIIPVNRKYGYYVNTAYNPEAQKDFRIYHMNEMVGNRITKYNRDITDWFGTLHTKMGINMGAFSIVSVLQTSIAYCYIGIRCITDRFGPRIGIGSLTMYVNAAINFGTTIYAFGEKIVVVNQMLSYLEPFMELISIPDEKEQGGHKILSDNIRSISFEHVSFSYPNGHKRILEDVSFTIHQGEKISIVGLNGAGKTTLVKLLCRLYHPDSGQIKINDIDIFEYDYQSYLSRISAVFQDFKLFNFSIEENITCQPLGYDEAKVDSILHQVNLSDQIKELKDGAKSLLGKQYDEDGIEMSGGQMQKVAIARALYKGADFIILDEPTSALDPIAEAEIYEQFNSMVGERTAIYISHRMSSSVFCNKVLILDGGKVADFDSHVNLMKKTDSLYFKLFNAQAENYKLS